MTICSPFRVTKMGATPLSDEERSEILKSRELEEKKYRSEAHREFDCFTSGHIKLYKRTIRKAQEVFEYVQCVCN